MKATNSFLQKNSSVKTRQSSTSVKLGTRQGATAPPPWLSSIISQEYIQSPRMHKQIIEVVIPQPTENLKILSMKLCFKTVLYRSY